MNELLDTAEDLELARKAFLKASKEQVVVANKLLLATRDLLAQIKSANNAKQIYEGAYMKFMRKYIKIRWNEYEKRAAAMARHEKLVSDMLKKFRLETICTTCSAVMPTSTTQIKCEVCGSINTVSPHYC